LFLNGISAHKLKAIAEQLTGRPVSAQTVSAIVQNTDQELQQYRAKPTEDKYEYLFLDGIYDNPKERWTKIRTTNILERSFREIRHRTRPMGGSFVNPASAERIYHNAKTLSPF